MTRRRLLTVCCAAAGTVLLLAPLWPYLTADHWPAAWDFGGHHIPMRQWGSWLAQGRTVGWDHSWFNGYPVYQFYFPGGWFIWQTFNVALSEVAAYRLLGVAAWPALGLAVWWLARSWGLSLPRSAAFAVCIAFSVAAVAGAFGGNVGLYAHQWSIVFGFGYLAALNFSAASKGGWGGWQLAAFLLLAVSFLCHPYPAVLIGVASLLLLPTVGWRTFTAGVAVAGGLTAWWWLPFAAHLHVAYLDMWRPTRSWYDIWFFTTAVNWSPPGTKVWYLVTVAAGVLTLAAIGSIRLACVLPDRRVLWPFAAMIAAPFANELLAVVSPDLAASIAFDNGRVWWVWFLAVGALAAYAVVDLVGQLSAAFNVERRLGRWRVAAVACVAFMSLLVLGAYRANQPSLLWHTGAGVPHEALVATTWISATHWVDHGQALPLDVRSLGVGRAPSGLHRESSPTARFWSALPSPLPFRSRGWHDYDTPSSGWTVRTASPVPQYQTWGVDVVWAPPLTLQPHTLTLGNISYWLGPRSGPGLLPVPAPPEQWPLTWINPHTITYRQFLDHSLREFGGWQTTDDVTIPVHGVPPEHASDADTATAAVVDVDWTDNKYVRFTADSRGLVYVASSWHPNWQLEGGGAGPWPAGPNQMIVWADSPGDVTLVWGKSWAESVGQIVSGLVVVGLLVWTVRGRMRRRESRGGSTLTAGPELRR